MKVTLLDHTLYPEKVIGHEAAICYDGKLDEESCIKRAINCKDRGHLSTLRFAYATFNVSGISRVCSHQLVRLAHGGILQRSQRYCKETDISYVTPNLACLDHDMKLMWAHIQKQASLLYAASLEQGMKKEDARYILPQGCETELNVCLNYQGWTDFIAARTDKAAQWEIRDVAVEIKRQLGCIAPNIFGGNYEYNKSHQPLAQNSQSRTISR